MISYVLQCGSGMSFVYYLTHHKSSNYHVQYRALPTFSCKLWTALSTQPTVPSPPATSTVAGSGRTGASIWHHSRATCGGQQLRSTACAGLSRRRKKDNTISPSPLPDLLFAKRHNDGYSFIHVASQSTQIDVIMSQHNTSYDQYTELR